MLQKYGAVLHPALKAFLELPLPSASVNEKSYNQLYNLQTAQCLFWQDVRSAAVVATEGPNGNWSFPAVHAYTEPLSAACTASYTAQWKAELSSLLHFKLRKGKTAHIAQTA